MKSKKAQARRAAEQAEAQAKLDRVEGYKDHFRSLLGMTIDDMAVESLTAPASDPLRGLSWPALTQMRILPAQHDHIYQSPREWANAQRVPVSGRMEALLERSRSPGRFAQQIAQAFATRPTTGMMAGLTSMLATGNTVTGRATSQRVDSLPPRTLAPELLATLADRIEADELEDEIESLTQPTDPPEDV